MVRIRTANVKVLNVDLEISAYLATPTSVGSYPGIILQEIFGVNAHIQQVTKRIAKEGYVAIALALFQRITPGFETGYTPKDIEIGRNYKGQTTASELLSDIQATIDYLKIQPQVKKMPSVVSASALVLMLLTWLLQQILNPLLPSTVLALLHNHLEAVPPL
jgi:carboxymethylenebutenolidase